MTTQMVEIGNKIKSHIIKLQGVHGKDKILTFNEKGNMIKIKMLPKIAADTKALLRYEITESRSKNVAMLLLP